MEDHPYHTTVSGQNRGSVMTAPQTMSWCGRGPETLSPDQTRDLLEIVEDRYDAGSLVITSQAPVDRWHEIVGNPTLADAILDRVIHNAYRIELAGESMRKRRMLEPST